MKDCRTLTRSLTGVVVLLLGLTALCRADDAALEQALRTQFTGKVVIIRGFYTEPNLQFDLAGRPKRQYSPGPWTIWGRMEVMEVKVKTGKVHMSGRRILTAWPQGQRTLLRTDLPVDVTVDLSQPGFEESALKMALGQIFVNDDEDMSTAVPEYWRDYFKHAPAHADPSAETGGGAAEAPASPKPPLRVRVSQAVSAGSLLHEVRPLYPEMARRAQIQGSVIMRAVISREGVIEELRIMAPAGGGLDEAAAEAVRQWRYRPYLLNGEPVIVETQITVNFTLAGR